MAAESEPTLEWLTSDGTLPQHGGLAELAAQCRPGTALRVAVPGDAMTLTEVQLPAGKRALWRKATPYALEDSLAEPVEQLHFALAERPLPSAEQMADDNTDTRTARIPVAVVRRATLQRWLARFKQHGLSPAAMVPEPLLLPYQPGTWSVLLDAEHGRAVVRTDAYAGFSCELALLPTYLRLALTASRLRNPKNSARRPSNACMTCQ